MPAHAEPLRPRRCRCGHLLTDHMRVVPLGVEGGGSYRLEPTGPCAVCPPSGCARFHPAGGSDAAA